MSFLKRIFFSGIVVLLTFLSTHAQSSAESDDEELRWYESFFRAKKPGSPDKALDQSLHSLREAREAGNVAGEIRLLKERGLIHLVQTHLYDSAVDNLIKALSLEDSAGMREQQVFTYLALARVFEEVSDYEKSAQLLKEALVINEQFKSHARLVRILNDMGSVSAARGRIEEAFDSYQLVLKYKDVVADKGVEAEALYNVGKLYQLQSKYNEALEKFREALALFREKKDKKNEALLLNEAGNLYALMKNQPKAMANFTVALEIYQRLGHQQGEAESYNNVGALLFEKNEITKAISNLELGLKAAREAQDQNQIRKSADYLHQCYVALGDYKRALDYQQLVVDITDFMLNDKNEQQILESQSRYSLEKKEVQISNLESDRVLREKKIEEQTRFRNFLFIVIGLGVVIGLLVFYMYLSKQRTNKMLQVVNAKVQEQNTALQDLNATKDKFFSIISHDLKGPLNSLTSFSGLLINHSDSLSKEEIKMLAQDLDKSLKNLFALLENLLEWSRSQTGNIEFKPEPFDLAAVLESNKELLKAQAANKNISVVNTATSAITIDANKNSVNTVIRNLISNAIKFTPSGGTITLQAKRAPGEVVVSIRDTGVGMSPEILQKLFRIDTKHSTKGTAEEKGTGLGLILCKEFIEKNGGRIWVESELGKGSVFSFALKN